jgi:putative flavoprotein involved in K+ transport
VLHLGDDLQRTTATAQQKLERLLARVDAAADAEGIAPESWPDAIDLPASTPARLDLQAEGIRTVVWATGFRRNYDWLKVPVLDPQGEVIHRGGSTPSPGLFVLGLRFLRHRRSNFLDGVGSDAEALSWHILGHLTTASRAAA